MSTAFCRVLGSLRTGKGNHSLMERLERPLLNHVDAVALASGLDQQTRRVRPRHSMDGPCTGSQAARVLMQSVSAACNSRCLSELL